MRANNFSRDCPPATLANVWDYAYARHKAYLHNAGLGPATPDKAILQHSFTNLKRSLDRGTVELQLFYEGWTQEEIGFVVAVSRVINKADIMLHYAPALAPYRAARMVQLIEQRKASGLNLRHSAYLVTTHGQAESFESFYASKVFVEWWAARKLLVAPAPTLQEYAERIQTLRGIGAFLAGQIVADLKPRLRWMQRCPDYDTWFILGPGSKRALRILDRPAGVVLDVRRMVNTEITGSDYLLDAQDAQNVLCEFDKWWRVKHGHGYRRKRVTVP